VHCGSPEGEIGIATRYVLDGPGFEAQEGASYVLTLISGFRRDVDVIYGLLGDYTASCGNYLPTFRDNVSVPFSWVKIPRWKEKLSFMGQDSKMERKAFFHGPRFQDGKKSFLSILES
jgi:hypothetical protein